MSLSKQFNRTLDKLWHRRTAELRALVVAPGKGPPLKFTKKIRQKYTHDLLELVTRLIMVRGEGKRAFEGVVAYRKLRQIRGRGLDNRFRHLYDWARQECPGPVVYVFWKGKKCLYVGKGVTFKRLKHYEKHAYLNEATSLEVFGIHGKSQVPKGECLATHLFKPRDNKNKVAKAKWGKACPICKKHDRMRRELRSLFSMK